MCLVQFNDLELRQKEREEEHSRRVRRALGGGGYLGGYDAI